MLPPSLLLPRPKSLWILLARLGLFSTLFSSQDSTLFSLMSEYGYAVFVFLLPAAAQFCAIDLALRLGQDPFPLAPGRLFVRRSAPVAWRRSQVMGMLEGEQRSRWAF
jgi:hypothetical protein